MSIVAIEKQLEQLVRDTLHKLPPIEEAIKLLGPAKEVLVSHVGGVAAEAAAYEAYWILRTLGKPFTWIGSLEDIAYHTLAYTKGEVERAILLVAEEGTDNSIARMLDAAKLTETRLVIVKQGPLHPLLEQRLPDTSTTLEVVMGNPILALQLLAVKVAARTSLESPGDSEGLAKRAQRILEEVESLPEVVDELLHRYAGAINKIRGVKERAVIAYSTTMRPPALILSDHYIKNGIVVRLLPLSELAAILTRGEKLHGSTILLRTGVEDDYGREIGFKLSTRGMKHSSIEVRINTDPLTAPLYATLILLPVIHGR